MSAQPTAKPFSKKKRPAPPVTVIKEVATRRPAFRSGGYNVRVTIQAAGVPEVIEYHLDDGTTTISPMSFNEFVGSNRWTVLRTPSSNAARTDWLYPATSEYVEALTELDDDDPDYVDQDVADRANQVLNIISVASKAPAPQVFSHGGDAVVFTWEGSHVAKLLTVTTTSLRLLAATRGSKDRQSVSIDLDKNEDRLLLIQTLGGAASFSIPVEDDL